MYTMPGYWLSKQVCCNSSLLSDLQAYISRARVDSFSLTADMMYVASNAPRIARALFEIAARRKWNSAAGLLLEVCKVPDHPPFWLFCSTAFPSMLLEDPTVR